MAEKILGTVQLGMPYGINNGIQPARGEALSLLGKAHELGITTLDTATLYGESMEIIGEYHAAHPDRKFKVFSKFILADIKGSGDELITSQSRQLNVSTLEGIFFHRYSEYMQSSAFIDSFKAHIACKLGVSLYLPEEFEVAAKDERIDLIQVPLSIFHHETPLYDKIKSSSTRLEIFVRSIYLQGLIFLPLESLTGKLEAFLPVRKFLFNIASEIGITEGELAASYVMDFTQIKGILFGAETEEQLKVSSANLVPRSIDWNYVLRKMPRVPSLLLHPGNWT